MIERGYERMYGGLGYVTFVNGRTTRRELGMEEMESVLGDEKAHGPELKECSSLGKVEVEIEVGGEEWSKGLERAVGEAILIAKDRVKDRVRKLGFVRTA